MNHVPPLHIVSSFLVGLLVSACSTPIASTGKETYDESQMRYIDNGIVKVGVNLGLGGAITYVSDSKNDKNLVNNFDWGRQIQISFFGGPVPYTEDGREPKEHWKHIGWNPIQAGDDFGNGSQVVELEVNPTSLYVKCIPMQWPLDNVPGECTYESWIELDGTTVQVRCRLNNGRSDTMQYGARHQELPAVYTNGEFYRLMTYRGDKPFSGDGLTRVAKKEGPGFPWDYWLATEHWAALVNENDWGLGIYKPDTLLFIGGFAGEEGQGDTFDNSTGYISPLHSEILDHNITYDYRYTLILGNLADIRAYAVQHGDKGKLPDWHFEENRQHWHYQAIPNSGAGTPVDSGWPIAGHLHLELHQPGITAVSPPTLWEASTAPLLHIEAAFKTKQDSARVAWTPFSETAIQPSFDPSRSLAFDIHGDEAFRTYTIDLAASPQYTGACSYLFFKPVEEAEQEAWVKIRRIWFSAAP